MEKEVEKDAPPTFVIRVISITREKDANLRWG
jgi:hypothetical protein